MGRICLVPSAFLRQMLSRRLPIFPGTRFQHVPRYDSWSLGGPQHLLKENLGGRKLGGRIPTHHALLVGGTPSSCWVLQMCQEGKSSVSVSDCLGIKCLLLQTSLSMLRAFTPDCSNLPITSSRRHVNLHARFTHNLLCTQIGRMAFEQW